MSASQAQTTARVGDKQRYVFNLKVAPEVGVVLYRYLEIVRRQYDDDIDREQLIVLADRAARQARNLLATEGYFDPQVQVQLDESTQPPQVNMQVTEGAATRVHQVHINFVGSGKTQAETFYESQKLDAVWQLQPGKIFRQQDWENNKTALLRRYLLDIFPLAKITFSEARIDPEQQRADLQVDIEAGLSMLFGELRIEGLQRYQRELIDNIVPIQPGQAYSQTRLVALQAAIQSLPYFHSVTVSPVIEEIAEQRIPIRIQVEEGASQRVVLGAGYSSNTGMRGQVGYRDLNLRDRGWQFDSLAKLETRQQSLEASLKWPQHKDGWQEALYANYANTDIQGLQTQATQLKAERTKTEARIERGLSLRFDYSLEKPSGSSESTAKALLPGYSWTYRALDNLLYPRRGFVVNLQAGFAVRDVLSDQNLIRTYGKGLFYLPLGELNTLTLRLEGGAVLAPSREGIPQNLLFRAGGDQSVRGYSYQSLGITEGSAIVGARYLATATVEYTHWLSSEWGAGVFVDAGDAFDVPADFKPALGVGGGPRWRSPVGPINIDLAWGERNRDVRLHFSLGFVF